MIVRTCRNCGAKIIEWYVFNMDDKVSPDEAYNLSGEICSCTDSREGIKYKDRHVDDGVFVVLNEEPG